MPKNNFSPKWRPKRFPFSGFDFTVKYRVVDLFKSLEKICRPRGRIFEIFWVKVQKFKKPLRELRAKIRKSKLQKPSNFSCLPPRLTLAAYVERKTTTTFFAPSPERRFGRKFRKFAKVQSLRPYISKSKLARTASISGWIESLP